MDSIMEGPGLSPRALEQISHSWMSQGGAGGPCTSPKVPTAASLPVSPALLQGWKGPSPECDLPNFLPPSNICRPQALFRL